MAEFFISYSRTDKPICEKLVLSVREVYGDKSVWYDPDIPGGVDWWSKILDEIKRCDIFVYLVSDKSLESSYCQDELRESQKHFKKLLPVIVAPLTTPYPGNAPPNLADVLKEKQYIDLSGSIDDLKKFWESVNQLRNLSKPISLTRSERWILSNQFAILTVLYPDEKDMYENMRDVIDNGYELNYGWISQYISDDQGVMSIGECSEVIDILDMFSFLKYSYEDLQDTTGIDVANLEFLGFDGNGEAKYLAYARYIIEREEKFTHIGRGHFNDFNSHMPTLHRYRKMLKEWEKSSDMYHLSREDLIRIGSK